MPDSLPTINFPSSISLPAVAAVSGTPVGYLSDLGVSTPIGGAWTHRSSVQAVNANGSPIFDPATGKPIMSVISRNLQNDIADFPLVAQGAGVTLVASQILHSVHPIEEQIKTGLATIKASQASVAASTAKLAALAEQLTKQQETLAMWSTAEAGKPASNGGIYTAPDIARHLTSAQAAVAATQAAVATETTASATAQTALTTAENAVWVSSLGEWRMAVNPLGVVDVNALPRVLAGLTAPAGV